MHAAAFRGEAPRAVVNIGGISNLTGLPALGVDSPVLGFDCGPGNVLIDAGRPSTSASGRPRRPLAAGGACTRRCWRRCSTNRFSRSRRGRAPARDRFNRDWLDRKLAGFTVDPRDVQATLTQTDRRVIGHTIGRYFAEAAEVVVCGGGAFNATLMRMLAQAARRARSSPPTPRVAPDQVEALAFAWLARSSSATGARKK